MTGLLAHGVGLALVLGHAGVNLLDNIGSDGGGKDGRDRMASSRRRAIFADDCDGRSGGHREVVGLCETCGLVRNLKLHKARSSWWKPNSMFWGWYAYLDSGVDGWRNWVMNWQDENYRRSPQINFLCGSGGLIDSFAWRCRLSASFNGPPFVLPTRLGCMTN